MSQRKSTGKRLRFRIFERDGFTCQYCGKRPPEVILHIDHVFPVSKGGKDEIENLLTSCADCNLGKSTFEIGKSPKRVLQSQDDLQEKYDQLKAFYTLQKKMDFVRREMINDLEDYWNELWQDEMIGDQGLASLRRFMRLFSVDEIKDAMDIAKSKIYRSRDAFKYTCGILHTKLKQKNLTSDDEDYDIPNI